MGSEARAGYEYRDDNARGGRQTLCRVQLSRLTHNTYIAMARPNQIKHDSNARQDEKLLALRLRLGWEGYGLYWGILEILRDSTDYTGSKDYNEIAFGLRVSAGLVKKIVEDFGLFTFTEDGKRFYSKRLSKDMDKQARISEKRKQAIQKRWNKRDTSVDTNVYTNGIQLYDKEKVPLSSPLKENEERSPIPPKEVKEIYPPIIPPKESARRGQCARTHEEGAKENFGEVVDAEVNAPTANISAGAEKEKSCAKKEREWELDLPAEVSYYPCEEERILSQASDYAEVPRGAEEDSYPQATRGDFATVMSWWNMNIAKGHITVVSELTRTRRYKLIERIAEWRTKSQGGSLGETLSRIEKQIEASSLLRGDKGRWVITFDWLIADDTNWVKVLEGNYNDNTNNKNGTGDRYANRRGREGAVASAESFAKWDGKF